MVVAAEAAVAEVAAVVVAAVMAVAAVVVLLVVKESHGTILGLKIARFRRFLKGVTDTGTYGQTDRPSYRDARTHLKKYVGTPTFRVAF